MKTLCILTRERPSYRWKKWIDALADTQFAIKEINLHPADYKALLELKSDAVLLDGMLPHLSHIIILLRALHADIPIIIASEATSFAIQYEVWELGEKNYISGPMGSDKFKKAIQNMVPAAEHIPH
ncbi:MAG TPA: hypothetical protein VJ904_12535 [Tichowtungia sp.]|nr:hypothetical protein [Tichowtungia sp.]